MKLGRNELCPCGSGKKYKKCCYLENPQLNQKEYIETPDDSIFTIIKEYKNCKDMSKEEILELLDDHILFLGNEESAINHLISHHGFTKELIVEKLKKEV